MLIVKTASVLILLIAALVTGLLFMQADKEASISVRPSPTKAPAPVPEEWDSYSDEIHKYSISFPEEFEVRDNGENSRLIIRESGETAAGPANFAYISSVLKNSVVEDGEIYNYNQAYFETLDSLSVGESKVVRDVAAGQAEWFTYTRLPDEQVSGHAVKVFVNKKPWEFPAGTLEYVYYLATDETLFILGGYVSEKAQHSLPPALFRQIISSFKFINER